MNYWNILIVDDIPDFHRMIKMIFRNYTFQKNKINFVSAYSAYEARRKLEKCKFELILLDVVMESKNAGLDLVRFIRGSLNDVLTRIIVITGHPGDIPASKVIMDYAIDNFIEKGDLLSQHLYTSITACLRTYCALNEAMAGQEIQKKLKHFASNFSIYSSVDVLAKAVFDTLVETESINHPAVFFNDVLKHYQTDRKLLENTFQKWVAGGRSATQLNDFLIYTTGDYNDYTFMFRCKNSLSKNYALAIFEQVRFIVGNLRFVINSDLFKKICTLGYDRNSVISVKADGRAILVDFGKLNSTRIELSISDVSMFFDESFLTRVHRSHCVNPSKICEFRGKRVRSLKMVNGSIIPVGPSYYKAFDQLKIAH